MILFLNFNYNKLNKVKTLLSIEHMVYNFKILFIFNYNLFKI